ncbi:amidohydrolase family protein [Coraliomargarita parva]|uniref:amidohydrolase family protein n=1 Tax=Coraliomargarita parva TaxID=3014050 RepID=UPI0022B5038D|nr:amidohydrolase family protein [Coraliomargarita parva]
MHRFTLLSFLSIATLGQAATLYQGATIVSLADGDDTAVPGWILVDDNGYIEALGSGAAPEAASEKASESIDLSGQIVMPGFVSGHSHLWQSAFRGIAPDGELWPWLDAIHRTYGDDFAEGDLAAVTTHGALDQLVHGVTTTYNHSHWLDFPAELYFEQFQAEAKLPQRFVYAHCLPLKESPAVWREQIDTYFPEVQPAPDAPFLGLSLNVRNYGSEETLDEQIKLANELGLTYQLHYLEQSSRQEGDRAEWPSYMEHKVVGPRTTFAHFIHTDAAILKDAAAAGAAMVWNPLSNGRLGSGLADIPGYLKAGLGVGMGVDGQASADISDPFENMRMGLYATRMQDENADGLQPIDMLRLHTLRTAEVLKVDAYVGSLEPGKFADFLVIDPKSPATGPVWNPASHLVFSCSSANITAIYVGGKKVVEDGKVPGQDLAALSTEVAQRIAAIQERQSRN